MTYGPVGLSYPKHRELQTIIFAIARTDSATHKATLPKDAVVCDIHVVQSDNASTGAGSFTVGLDSDATALVTAFSMTTNTAPRFTDINQSVGASFLTKLTADKKVTSTYTVGSSSAGGTGYVVLKFFQAGPGEAIDD